MAMGRRSKRLRMVKDDGRSRSEETVMFDQAFDCLIGRILLESKHRREPNLRSYKDVDDDRLQVSFMKDCDG